MPTARELLEQADKLMQRNRARSAPAADDGIPTLMDVVPPPALSGTSGVTASDPAPALDAPPARSAAADLDDVPLLTDVVEEIDAPSILEPPDLDDPDAWSDTLTGVHSIIPDDPIILPDPAVVAAAASRPSTSSVSAAHAAFASPDIPAAEWDAAVAPYVTTESIDIGVPAGPGDERATFDEDATWTPGWLPVATPEEASPEQIEQPQRTDSAGVEPPIVEPPVAEPPVAAPPVVDPPVPEPPVPEPPVAHAPAAEPADFPAEPSGLMEPELSDVEIASAARNPAPIEADQDLAALAREVPAPPAVVPPQDDARWAALAEEIRMQVLQRIDIFTDTGLGEQLAQRLQPAVDRASADLVATINQHVGLLLRAYVAEAIEREIENWRRDSH